MGLFLAIKLYNLNISCIVLEKRPRPRPGSRSLGIHPISLELFEDVGLAEKFIREGIKIKKGIAFINAKKVGEISFEHCPPPYKFILSLPQYCTETILNTHVDKIGGIVLREAKVTSIQQDKTQVRITYKRKNETKRISGKFLVGCDGKNSITRKHMDSNFAGRSYPDTYIMGDFSDDTTLGSDAAVYLCDDGLIESFPLKKNKRRWVVKTETYISEVNRQDIEKRVYRRIGKKLQNTENFMLSSFGVHKYLATPMVNKRLILAGDAAHIVSPIGGQGMNLGWLGALDLAQVLDKVFHGQMKEDNLISFQQRRIKAAKNAMWRAELNMKLGRKSNYTVIKKGILNLMVNTPLSHLLARLFTMRGIETQIL